MKKLFLLLAVVFSFFGMTNCDSPEGGLTGEDLSLTDGYGKYSGGITGGSNGGNGDSTNIEIKPGQITAGEWSDLDNWHFTDSLLVADTVGYQTYWSFFVNNRISVKVVDAASRPAVDIKVELKRNGTTIWTAKTDNSGKAELWSGLFQSDNANNTAGMLIVANNQVFDNVKNYAAGVNQLKLSVGKTTPNKVDIAFVVDATGSMGDELEYLKVELLDVINAAKKANPDVSMSTGSVFYRDEGDEYVTRMSDFSTNIQTTLNFIKNQRSAGGGDYPEAVHKALDKAVNNLQWSASARTRLLFLVLDAPPHYTTDVVKSLQESIKSAAAAGIKIIPVTASGTDKQTEFVTRFFDIATNGTYVFITNDSGIGNDHIKPTIGKYEVEYLNNLLVRLINKYVMVTQPG